MTQTEAPTQTNNPNEISPYYSIATDGGIHRRCVPYIPANAPAWLLEPAPVAHAQRYEVARTRALEAELERLTAEHGIAEAGQRGRLAGAMNAIHAELGSAARLRANLGRDYWLPASGEAR